jgi:hypothetical protein
MRQKIIILIFTLLTTTGFAQIKVKSGLLLGGGKGSLCDVNMKGRATDFVEITSTNSSYKYNAMIDYKLRMENTNENKWFYDMDLGFALKGINFEEKGTYVDEDGNTFPVAVRSGSYSLASFSIGLSANYKIVKGLYAGIGIEPTCYFHDLTQYIKIFDAPLIGKLGYDFKYFDIAVVYKKGLLNALQSDNFSKGRINDLQLQLFIPF